MRKHLYILLVAFLISVYSVSGQTITTFAGKGTTGYTGDGALAIDCELNHPFGIAVDLSGNVYVADRHNNAIRKVNPAGIVTTIAGNGNAAYSGDGGPATAAELNSPVGVAVDGAGNVYIGDLGNYRIRKVTAAGIMTTVAGTGISGYNGDNIAATLAQLANPRGVTIDVGGNVYIADQGNNRIRKVNIAGVITTVAGTVTTGYSGDGGPATAAELRGPYAIAFDGTGNMYIADVDNQRIRKVNTFGIISTTAGNGIGGYSGDWGPATMAQLYEPIGVTVDGNGAIYVADGWNGRIRQVNASGIISTIAGNGVLGYGGDGGPANLAQLNDPYSVATDGGGNIYISDYANNRVRRVTHPTGVPDPGGPTLGVTMAPNPCNGVAVMSILSNYNEPVTVAVTNILGEKVKECNINTSKPVEISLDAPDGIYMLTAISAHATWSGKLVICH